jgi:hypothetical protein
MGFEDRELSDDMSLKRVDIDIQTVRVPRMGLIR